MKAFKIIENIMNGSHIMSQDQIIIFADESEPLKEMVRKVTEQNKGGKIDYHGRVEEIEGKPSLLIGVLVDGKIRYVDLLENFDPTAIAPNHTDVEVEDQPF